MPPPSAEIGPSRASRALSAVWRVPAYAAARAPAEGGPRHDRRTASILGMALGVTFGLCFLTGLLSDQLQNPLPWFRWSPDPTGLYRVTQGVHVWTGLASVPLLLAKLFTVAPKLWRWPPFESPVHALERLTIAPLVGGAIFLLLTGVQNIASWYPWGFSFTAGHLWAAWITIGAMVVHVGAKVRVIGELRRERAAAAASALPAPAPAPPAAAPEPVEGGLTRRGVLGVAFGGSALLVATFAGSTVPLLRRTSILAPRDVTAGPQGFPVNTTARSAGVVAAAASAGWRLEVVGAVDRDLRLSRADLERLPQRTAELPIACVEGWSTVQRWTGVPLRDLLAMAGAAPGASAHVVSLQERSPYGRSDVEAAVLDDPDTLVALAVGGEPLHVDHGYPARLIAPNRPGVLQTKWLTRVEVR
jgi:hypothetical protein